MSRRVKKALRRLLRVPGSGLSFFSRDDSGALAGIAQGVKY
jgi:hypothetical protein